MRQRQRRESAREWIGSGATVTVKTYRRRYGVDGYTACDDLTFLGFALPASAQQWAQRPPATPRRAGADPDIPIDDLGDDPCSIMLDGRLFFVAGYTSGGAPYGMFADEMDPFDDLP